jgi:hypothetical protein
MKSQQFCGPRFGYFSVSTSHGRNFAMQYSFGQQDRSLEMYR